MLKPEIRKPQLKPKPQNRLCFALRGGENCRSEGRGTAEPKKEKPKTTQDTKSESAIVFLTKTEHQMLKTEKFANRNKNQNRKTELLLTQKPKNRSKS